MGRAVRSGLRAEGGSKQKEEEASAVRPHRRCLACHNISAKTVDGSILLVNSDRWSITSFHCQKTQRLDSSPQRPQQALLAATLPKASLRRGHAKFVNQLL